MNTAAWACTVTGIGLLGLVALDVYRTILHSSGRCPATIRLAFISVEGRAK
jgi:hypothetical protein